MERMEKKGEKVELFQRPFLKRPIKQFAERKNGIFDARIECRTRRSGEDAQ